MSPMLPYRDDGHTIDDRHYMNKSTMWYNNMWWAHVLNLVFSVGYGQRYLFVSTRIATNIDEKKMYPLRSRKSIHMPPVYVLCIWDGLCVCMGQVCERVNCPIQYFSIYFLANHPNWKWSSKVLVLCIKRDDIPFRHYTEYENVIPKGMSFPHAN